MICNCLPDVLQVGQILRKLTAGSGKKLSLELGGKSPVVVFDSADLDSTVEGVVQAIWFNQGQVKSWFYFDKILSLKFSNSKEGKLTQHLFVPFWNL